MSESQEIHATLHEDTEPYISEYSKRSLKFIPDYNQQSYTQQIQWDTLSARNQLVCWRDAFVQIPLSLHSTNATPFTNATKVAFKQSILSLFNGIVFKNSGGSDIINESGINFRNNLDLLLDHNTDWKVQNAAELMFDSDNVVWSPAAPNGIPIYTAGTAATQNSGFLNRITFVQTQGFLAAGGGQPAQFNVWANIPLRLLSPIFDTMDFVMYGSYFQLYLQGSFQSTGQYPALLLDNADASETATDAGAISINTTNYGPCRLYYYAVELPPAEMDMLTKKLEKGYKVRRSFLGCDVYTQLSGLQNQTAVSVMNNSVITPNVVNPVRMYVLGYPTGAMSSSAKGTLPLAPVGTLTNVRVYINNTDAFPDTQMITTEDFWALLKDRLPDHQQNLGGGLVSWQDFLRSQRIHVFDLSKGALPFKGMSCNITMTASRGLLQNNVQDAVAVDWVVVIEKAMTCEFNLSQGSCTAVAGQNL